ncbi:hypothetical protein BDV27DRAFT_127699 [Aspergillus caelatus]|uniref:Uncharacterized protein n=1 Tax=Aspergillus caelatus TaxID=61420 RepID=A0A5N7A4Z2_9EURO|nr:uncharacterized protein BDV27DRAFT_127699 [Aspergillus caelatus]KAE8364927.1 hypothetical protein BDV27DRAFT_127699 [Aspergillus caelatus]
MFEFRRAIFAEWGPKVGSRDWEVVMDFNRKSNNMNTLRLLFYPTPEDNNNGDLVGKYLRLDSKWFSIWALPQLQSPLQAVSNKKTRVPSTGLRYRIPCLLRFSGWKLEPEIPRLICLDLLFRLQC